MDPTPPAAPKIKNEPLVFVIYLSRLRIPRLECVGFGEGLGAKAQD